eukprot:2821344-Amphidinium_carterae.1
MGNQKLAASTSMMVSTISLTTVSGKGCFLQHRITKLMCASDEYRSAPNSNNNSCTAVGRRMEIKMTLMVDAMGPYCSCHFQSSAQRFEKQVSTAKA